MLYGLKSINLQTQNRKRRLFGKNVNASISVVLELKRRFTDGNKVYCRCYPKGDLDIVQICCCAVYLQKGLPLLYGKTRRMQLEEEYMVCGNLSDGILPILLHRGMMVNCLAECV